MGKRTSIVSIGFRLVVSADGPGEPEKWVSGSSLVITSPVSLVSVCSLGGFAQRSFEKSAS